MNQNNGAPTAPPRTAARNLSQLFHRLIDLMELQTELFKMDAQSGLKSLAVPAVLVAVGLVFLFGSSVVLLIAVAAALSEGVGLSVTAAFSIATAMGLLLAAGALLLGWRKARRGQSVFERSQTELRNNINWFRETLKNQ